MKPGDSVLDEGISANVRDCWYVEARRRNIKIVTRRDAGGGIRIWRLATP